MQQFLRKADLKPPGGANSHYQQWHSKDTDEKRSQAGRRYMTRAASNERRVSQSAASSQRLAG